MFWKPGDATHVFVAAHLWGPFLAFRLLGNLGTLPMFSWLPTFGETWGRYPGKPGDATHVLNLGTLPMFSCLPTFGGLSRPSAFARAADLSNPQGPAREFLEAGDERRATGRAAGAGAGADRRDHGGILARAKPLHPIPGLAAHLKAAGEQWVLAQARVAAGARPGVAVGAADEAGPQGVAFDETDGLPRVPLVQRARCEPAGPDDTAVLARPAEVRGVVALKGHQRGRQRPGLLRHGHEVHVVGHQAPGPDLEAMGDGVAGQKVQEPAAVMVVEEQGLPAPGPQDDMVRRAGDDQPRCAWHGRSIPPLGGRVNYSSSRLTVASVCAVGSLAHRYKQAWTALKSGTAPDRPDRRPGPAKPLGAVPDYFGGAGRGGGESRPLQSYIV
jgi:hypothetical protein